LRSCTYAFPTDPTRERYCGYCHDSCWKGVNSITSAQSDPPLTCNCCPDSHAINVPARHLKMALLGVPDLTCGSLLETFEARFERWKRYDRGRRVVGLMTWKSEECRSSKIWMPAYQFCGVLVEWLRRVGQSNRWR